jgi:hypothetical protein
MILSGLFVSFDKIHESIGNKARTPFIADLMTSRWAFEAMAVYQFIHNDFESRFYEVDQTLAEADYKSTYYAEKLEDLTAEALRLVRIRGTNLSDQSSKEVNRRISTILRILYYEIHYEPQMTDPFSAGSFPFSPEEFGQVDSDLVNHQIARMKNHYRREANEALLLKDEIFNVLEASLQHEDLDQLKNKYYNERLADIVRNMDTRDRVMEYRGRLIQLIDPVFQQSPKARSAFDYRTHLYAPIKQIFGLFVPVYLFNLVVIWIFSLVLYFTLFFHVFRKILYSIKYKGPGYAPY